MNKTVTINLAGLVFHIDDTAFDVLRTYLEKLNAHFTGPSGKEVLNDIEARIAEMFQAKINPGKNVIILEDVNEVIAVMGKPEDITGESAGEPAATTSETTYKTGRKRVYRNGDDKVLGGVCAGTSAYFDIDPVWLRIAFVVAVIFGGSGILLYIILWIIIPEAKTASEKLEMRGEAINISNIQRNVQAEMENVKGNWEGKLNADGTRQTVSRYTQSTGNFIRDMLVYTGRFVITLVGILLSAFAIALLIGLSVMLFIFLGVIPAEGIPVDNLDFFVDPTSFWILTIGGLLLFGIPVLVLLLNGIKIIFRLDLSLKRTGAVLLILWLVGIGLAVWQGIAIGRQYRSQSYTSRTERADTGAAKTLALKANDIIRSGPFHAKGFGWEVRGDDMPLFFTNNEDTTWCANVRLDIDQSRNDSVYVTVTQRARGADASEARVTARRIEYAYSVQDSIMYFDNAFNLNHDKFRVQGVDVTLKIPVGFTVILDKSLKYVIYDIDNVTNVIDEDMIGHAWLMTEEGLECRDCTGEEKEIIVPEDHHDRHEKDRHELEIEIDRELDRERKRGV